MALNGLFCADVPSRNCSLTYKLYTEDLVILACAVLIRQQRLTVKRTDGQTDAFAIAKT